MSVSLASIFVLMATGCEFFGGHPYDVHEARFGHQYPGIWGVMEGTEWFFNRPGPGYMGISQVERRKYWAQHGDYVCFPSEEEWRRRRAQRAENRVIVNRKLDAKTPTLDGYTHATIVDPLLWYCDPDRGMCELKLFDSWATPTQGITRTDQKDRQLAARRNFLEFVLETPRPLPVFTSQMFR
ncbi:MAG: hypothetical protein EXR98_09470 [Gemmataceae bacterium]|nr:hypothetical protein [Gemmataceae bacterium]